MRGQPIELVVRVPDRYRKVDSNRPIAHEHVSVPVDVTTGKPDLMSKPQRETPIGLLGNGAFGLRFLLVIGARVAAAVALRLTLSPRVGGARVR